MGKRRMWAVTVVAATLLVLAAVPATAVPIGNPLDARAASSDGVTNVLSVYTDSPVPSDGVIDQALIYKQHDSDRAFRVFILRPTGTANEFDVVASTAPITNYGVTGQVHGYACSLPVEAGDLFAHTGYGIPYTQLAPPAAEPLYYPASTPVTGTTITLPSTAYPSYSSNRTYSLQLEHVAGVSALGNDLVPRTVPSDGVGNNVLQIYSDSPVTSAGFLSDARVYKQGDYDRDFEVYVLRPTNVAGQYAVAARSGPITTTGAVGEVQTYSLPNGPMLVQPGDLFAHSGHGIPYDNTGTQPLYYPYSAPAAGSTIIPPAPYTYRDYSLQVAETPAVVLGNHLIPRASASDGVLNLLNVYWDSPVPDAGYVSQVHMYNQVYTPGYTPFFQVMVLRPTGNPDEFDVVGQTGWFDPGAALGQLTFDLASYIPVEAGDLIAHYGRGIPYDQGFGDQLFYPVSTMPGYGDTITLTTAGGFRPYANLRTYSMAYTWVVPEPGTMAMLAMGGLGLVVRRRRRKA